LRRSPGLYRARDDAGAARSGQLAFAFLGSTLLLLIMSFGISQEVRDIPFAALDHDQTPESRAYLSTFEASNGSRFMP